MRRPLVPTLLTIFGATFAITGVSALEACDDEARPSEPDASPPDGVKAPNPGVPVTPGKPIENDDAGGVEAGVDDAGPDADTDAAPPAKRSRVFVTRTRYAGDLKVTGSPNA